MSEQQDRILRRQDAIGHDQRIEVDPVAGRRVTGGDAAVSVTVPTLIALRLLGHRMVGSVSDIARFADRHQHVPLHRSFLSLRSVSAA
jgi:hypothetical protein